MTKYFAKYESEYEKRRMNIVKKLIYQSHSSRAALDISCGIGVYSHILARKGFRVFGIDVDKNMLNVARKNFGKEATFIRMDATNLALRANSFDIILALEIIEHVESPTNLLNEIHRVSKKGSRIIISTPNRYSLEGMKGRIHELIKGEKWNAWDPSHRSIFSIKEIISQVQRYFRIEKIIGYYYLPKFSPKSDGKCTVNFLRYAALRHIPFNYFGFNIIVTMNLSNGI